MRLNHPIRVGAGLLSVWALVFAATGCGVLWSRHKVAKLPNLPMQTATLSQLVEVLNRQADSIRTVNAKVLLMASTGGERSGSITKYHEVQAYLLIRKPADIRLLGQFSIFGTIFDMASNGSNFELSIPSKGEFFTGRNDVIPSEVKNPLEKLRPQVILQALLINPIEPGQQVTAMNDNAETKAEYDVLVLAPDRDGLERLVRKVTFSRYDLLPRQQVIYQPDGTVATRADYGEFVNYDGIPFPSQVLIERPEEEYSIRMIMQSVTFNKSLNDGQFLLKQPAGTRLIPLSKIALPAASTSGGRR